jgi:hypothetical protein
MKEFYITILISNSGSFSIDITRDMFSFINANRMVTGNDLLVYYEKRRDLISAKARKKSLELWTEDKLKKLVQSLNPEFKDISFIWQTASSINV